MILRARWGGTNRNEWQARLLDFALSFIASRWHLLPVRRPDKTEMEFFLLMVLLVMPFAWFALRTVFALLG